jgi:hypothetical protein
MHTKYIIEGGLDFYNELYKSLDEESTNQHENNVIDVADAKYNLCLITNSELTENFVTLECNHKFNYLPLYNDIANHKKKYNNMERKMLKTTEIRCPYCRHVQTSLLPYYENMGVKKVHGVNFFDETHYKHSHAYIDSDEYLDGPCSHTVITHQGQVYKCDSILVVSFPEINKFYCKYHKYCGIKEVAKNKKIKDALELKKLAAEAKQKIAQEKAAQKESVKLAKLAIKAAKDEAKLANKLTKNNNEVSDNNNTNSILTQPDNNKCIQTLKTGANKGEQCGCKIFQNNLCTRHYNLNTKVYTV